MIFADQNLSVHPGDFWGHIKTTGLDNEGYVPFKNGKKPLALLIRLVIALNEIDQLLMPELRALAQRVVRDKRP